MRGILILLSLLTLTSCANYINKMHSEFDRADGKSRRPRMKKKDTFDRFRGSNTRPMRTSTASQPNVLPQVRRKYVPQNTKRRYTANDLVDNSNSASLWSGAGNDNYLFTKNKWKRNGDIVLINVKKGLKRSITLELKRAFPSMPKKKKKEAKPATPAAPATAATGEEANKDEKTYDKISSVIIEEISKDHLLVRGQKFLLYKNGKHLVEIQALVARKDILDDDTVDSNSFLESTVQVLR